MRYILSLQLKYLQVPVNINLVLQERMYGKHTPGTDWQVFKEREYYLHKKDTVE